MSIVPPENIRSSKYCELRADGMAGLAANVVTVAGAVGSTLILPALGAIIGMTAFQFLRTKYQQG